MYPEINSNEWYDILTGMHEGTGPIFNDFEFISTSPMVVKLRYNGKTFTINDDPPNTNRRRSLEELMGLTP